MRLSPLLPNRLRVGLNTLQQSLGDLRNARAHGERPVFKTARSPEELVELTRLAAEARQARLRQTAATSLNAEVNAKVRDLEIVEVSRPTAASITLVFKNPSRDPIQFVPGQFLTLMLRIDGEEVRRAYSFMSDCAALDTVAVTIKRVPGGRVSNHLADTAHVGMVLRALGPSGSFGTAARPDATRRVILVAGGSGITPLYAIAQAVSAQEPGSSVHLVFGNRSREDILFKSELQTLARRKNVTVTHVLERAHRGFKGPVGRLSGALLGEALPLDPHAEYYLCGPDPMMEGAIAYLKAGGVPANLIHMERFTAPERRQSSPSTGAIWSVEFQRQGALVQTPDAQTLLEAGLEAGLPMNFSCTYGGCGACKVRVVSGEVEMEEPNCLTEDERCAGQVLACVARARSAVVLDV